MILKAFASAIIHACAISIVTLTHPTIDSIFQTILHPSKVFLCTSPVYDKIYIKEDVHPSVRQEWRRLWEAKEREEERTENVGCEVHLNVREKKLYKQRWCCYRPKELAGFLGRPHQTKKLLKILSWNINGVKTKIEKNDVISFLLQFDIVSLNEVKTPLHTCLPGYIAFKSYDKINAHRGGAVVMIKDCLSTEVISVDTSIEDQVWMQLNCAAGIVLGFYYIPPSDSPYFSFY